MHSSGPHWQSPSAQLSISRSLHLHIIDTAYKMSVRSSSSSSGRSTASNITVKSTNLNVPRSKSLSVVTYLAGGHPSRHKHLRRQKTTTEYENGTYETTSQYFWVRDPYESTYYWDGDYDDYDDRSSLYSGSSGRSSRRSKHGGHKGRGMPAAVPVQPVPPPQHPMGMPGMPMGMPPGGMPPHMGGHPQPMMGGGPPPVQVMDDGLDDDDGSSTYSGSSYLSGSSYASHGMPQPPPNMGMPHMQHPPPPPMMHMGGRPMGPPMMTSAGPPPPRSHHGVDNGGGDDMPDFFQIS